MNIISLNDISYVTPPNNGSDSNPTKNCYFQIYSSQTNTKPNIKKRDRLSINSLSEEKKIKQVRYDEDPFAYAIEINDRALFKQLILEGKIPKFGIKESEFIHDLFEEIILNCLGKEDNEKFLILLIKNRLLPFSRLSNGGLALAHLIKHGSESLITQIKETYKLDDQSKDHLLFIHQSGIDSWNSMNLIFASKQKSLIMESSEILIEKGMGEIGEFLGDIKSELKKRKKTANEIIQKEKNKINDYISINYFLDDNKITCKREVDEYVLNDILSLSIQNKDPLQVGYFLGRNAGFDKNTGVNISKTNLLLDKHIKEIDGYENFIPLRYEGGWSGNQALIVTEALSDILRDLRNSHTITTIQQDILLQKICVEAIKGLSLFARWHIEIMCERDPKIIADEIIGFLQKPNLDHMILIPVGTKNHALCLCIERLKSNKYRATIINTGLGLKDNHPHDELTDLFQTWLSINGIEEEKLYDPEIWIKFIKAKRSDDISRTYDCFKGLGSLSEKSNPELYAKPQFRGTCSGSVIVKLLRYLICDRISGSNYNKLGAYKLFRAKLNQKIGLKNFEYIDLEIQDLVKRKVEKANSLVNLASHAKTDEFYNKKFDKLVDGLKYYGEHLIANSFKLFKVKLKMERVYLLHMMNKILSSNEI